MSPANPIQQQCSHYIEQKKTMCCCAFVVLCVDLGKGLRIPRGVSHDVSELLVDSKFKEGVQQFLRAILKQCARHHETPQPIPDTKFKKVMQYPPPGFGADSLTHTPVLNTPLPVACGCQLCDILSSFQCGCRAAPGGTMKQEASS